MTENEGMKKCPFCAEMIREEAIVCRYCGRDLPEPAGQSGPVEAPHSAPSLPGQPSVAKQAAKVAAVAAILVVVVFFLGSWPGPLHVPETLMDGLVSFFIWGALAAMFISLRRKLGTIAAILLVVGLPLICSAIWWIVAVSAD